MSASNNRNRCVFVAAVVTAWLVPSIASATFLTPDDIGATHIMLPEGGASYSYDSATDTFVSFASGTATLRELPFTTQSLIADDIIFDFSMSATIDENGVVSGGAFSWTGSSATLGILTPTTLVEGVIESPTSELLDQIFGFQFFGSIVTLDSVFASFVGDSLSFLLELQLTEGGCPTGGTFSCSFSGDTATNAPDLWLSPNAIPEPASLALLLIGLLAAICTRTGRPQASAR